MTINKRIAELEKATKAAGQKILVFDFIDRPTVKVGDVEMPRAEFEAILRGPEGNKISRVRVEYVATPIPW